MPKGSAHTSLRPDYDAGVEQILNAVGQVSVECIMHLPGQGLSHEVQTDGERFLAFYIGFRGLGSWGLVLGLGTTTPIP